MRNIIPYMWFDTEAVEAAEWYVSIFEDSEITRTQNFSDTPSGEATEVRFKLAGYPFGAINGGPHFTKNPSISVSVACQDASEVNHLYERLSEGGLDLMPLDSYPFNERYAWIEDKYGVSWQLMVAPEKVLDHKLRLNLLFSAGVCGKAREALEYYQSVFEGAEIGLISEYEANEAVDTRAKINYAELKFGENELVLSDNGVGGDYTYNEGFSLLLLCSSQAEIDYYFEKLSQVPEAAECGWVKDQFGVSWQIVPTILEELLETSTDEEIDRINQAILKMTKLNIEAIENAKFGL